MSGPPTFREWLRINMAIGALSFGGSVRIFLYRDAVVSRGWLTDEDFQESLTVVQIMPGPNLVNMAAYLGHRLFGVRGAACAVVVLGLPGALMGVAVVSLVNMADPRWTTLFRGFALGSLVLFAAFVATLGKGLSATYDKAAIAKGKLAARWTLALALAGLQLAGAPMLPVIFGGMAVGALVEFCL